MPLGFLVPIQKELVLRFIVFFNITFPECRIKDFEDFSVVLILYQKGYAG